VFASGAVEETSTLEGGGVNRATPDANT
jgi:hypothetical protein